MNKKDLLIWIDLETTGFDLDFSMQGCALHKIVEVGLHITDSQFNIVDEGINLIIHHEKHVLSQMMDSVVFNMHKNSGLLDEIERSTLSLSDAEKVLTQYLEKNGVEKGKSPICGNNVSFDKNFINAQMPLLSEYFHYRKIDVSSFKEVFKRFSPEVVNSIKKRFSHRAIEDIRDSIEEMKVYAKKLY